MHDLICSMREIKNRKLNRAKIQLYKLLDEEGAWDAYAICTFKHVNLYNKKEYIIQGRIISKIIDGDLVKYKILTPDGKNWEKHALFDEIKIIKPASGSVKKFTVDIPVKA